MRKNTVETFWSRVEVTGCCWWWLGGTHGKGETLYGVFTIDGVTHRAHRYAWGLLVGEIPDGLDLDHICLNHMCVNPDHLEPVTRSENSRRKWALLSKGSCPRSHPWSDGDWWIGRDGRRYCRTCHREAARARFAPKAVPYPRRTACKRGHPLSGENVIVDIPRYRRKAGARKCRTCEQERQRRYREARKATARM